MTFGLSLRTWFTALSAEKVPTAAKPLVMYIKVHPGYEVE